jgi:hypothetical protein
MEAGDMGVSHAKLSPSESEYARRCDPPTSSSLRSEKPDNVNESVRIEVDQIGGVINLDASLCRSMKTRCLPTNFLPRTLDRSTSAIHNV